MKLTPEEWYLALGEIERAYRVLLPWDASGQNWRDIEGWRERGYISQEEAAELHQINERMERERW